jgi:large subunit ribosomal protein L24
LTPRIINRSFGNQRRKHKSQTATLLDLKAREKRLAEAGEKALAAKYKRNQYNKDYRERRREQAEARKEKEDDSRTYDVAKVYRRAMQQPAKDSFKAMKEDWALGPLAPKRDVGDQAGKMGTVEMGLHQLQDLTKTQREDVKARMGDNVFKPHDRVVVLTGRDRGKIGNILSIDENKMSATIEGINKVC